MANLSLGLINDATLHEGVRESGGIAQPLLTLTFFNLALDGMSGQHEVPGALPPWKQFPLTIIQEFV
jgi:hypothetical protein